MKKGFTLIELLVAMAIIGILIGMTVFGISRAFRASRDTQRQNLAREINTAIVAYRGKTQKVPDRTQVTFTPDSGGNSGKVTVGSGTQYPEVLQADFKVSFSVSTTGFGLSSMKNEDAYVCYDASVTTGDGYALGVVQEDGTVFLVTKERGNCNDLVSQSKIQGQ